MRGAERWIGWALHRLERRRDVSDEQSSVPSANAPSADCSPALSVHLSSAPRLGGRKRFVEGAPAGYHPWLERADQLQKLKVDEQAWHERTHRCIGWDVHNTTMTQMLEGSEHVASVDVLYPSDGERTGPIDRNTWYRVFRITFTEGRGAMMFLVLWLFDDQPCEVLATNHTDTALVSGVVDFYVGRCNQAMGLPTADGGGV